MQQKHSLRSINGWLEDVLLFPGLRESSKPCLFGIYIKWSAYEVAPKRS